MNDEERERLARRAYIQWCRSHDKEPGDNGCLEWQKLSGLARSAWRDVVTEIAMATSGPRERKASAQMANDTLKIVQAHQLLGDIISERERSRQE